MLTYQKQQIQHVCLPPLKNYAYIGLITSPCQRVHISIILIVAQEGFKSFTQAIVMFTDDPSEEDASIMQPLLLFLFANTQHFLRMRLLYLTYSRTVYIPMLQMLLATPIQAQNFQSF